MKEQDFQNIVAPFAEADEFSGAVLVAHGHSILFKRAYGLASQRYHVPNQVDTKFNLGSMNKMFTGVAIVQLAEQGKLSFDDTINNYLPDYPHEVGSKVTIHHLLTHTSGMGTYFNERFDNVWAELRTVEDFIPLFRDDALSFEPGERFQYSNSGFILLGAIIERVTGQDYFSYVRDHIYQPANMTDTDAYEMDRSIPNLAIGYTRRGEHGELAPGERRNNLFLHVVKGGPAGGGFSTIDDLHRFSLALQEHRLLSPKYTDMLLSGKVERTSSGAKYAYGFGDEAFNGHRIVGHNGGAPGISSRLHIYLDMGYTVVVLSNYDPPIADKIADQLREQLLKNA